MPRYTKKTAELKAKKVAKSFIENGMNSGEVARKRNTTPQNEGKKFRSKPVQDALDKYFNSPKLKKKLVEVAREGLEAKTKLNLALEEVTGEKGGDIPDFHIRHKFWRDILTIMGKLKNNGNGHKISVIVQFTQEERKQEIDRIRSLISID